MFPAGMLKGFNGRIQYKYGNNTHALICILLFYPKDRIATPIVDKIGLYDGISGNKFNFYLPGYLEGGTWCDAYNEFAFNIEGTPVHFCRTWFLEFIEYFEKAIPNYRYSLKPELLVFEVNNGRIDYNRKVLFNLKELQDNENLDFDAIFNKIYETVLNDNNATLTNLRTELGIGAAGNTLLDCFWAQIGKLPILKHLKGNCRGIYLS